MRRKISLYIGDRLADLDEQSFILFNYTMEDMANPTIVKNSFSRTVKLKRTKANNAIFGSFFRPDRKTISEGGQTGAAFNPLQQVPFSIYNDMDEIIESGYVELKSVDKDAYEIYLYGGLGSFFYALSYNEDGSRKTLADLVWRGYDGTDFTRQSAISFRPDSVLGAWNYLRSAVTGNDKWYNFLNFAPAYNGFIEGFDYKHAVIGEDTFLNFPKTRTEGEDTYLINGQTTIAFEANHMETEVANLVSILQRPVVSVKALFEAISNPANNGGYNVVLDSSFFSSSNDWYSRGWITLDLPAKKLIEKVATSILLGTLMEGTSAPADYLIGFAKMLGLVFVTDSTSKTITICSRDTFYTAGETIDLSTRIEAGSEKILPFQLSSKLYALRANDVKGQFADYYKEKYNRTYGEQVINTGYSFNTEEKELLKDIVYKGAVDYLAGSPNFCTIITNLGTQLLPIAQGENVTVKMQRQGTLSEKKDFPSAFTDSNTAVKYWYDGSYPLRDVMPMTQFANKDGKPTGGANVLLILSGFPQIPLIGDTQVRHNFYLTNGLSTISINDGVPCFDLRMTGTPLTFLPSFRRWRVVDGEVGQSFEFGIPSEVSDPHIATIDADGSIYQSQWKRYLTDRYDVDSKVMNCKVNLRGLQTGQGLLRNFYYYKNCLWVLNRIINHSLTTWDLTDCEFVRVQSKDSYRNGQNY